MTKDEIARLRDIAQAAHEVADIDPHCDADTRYIYKFRPAKILALLDLIESQRVEIERLTKGRDEARADGIREAMDKVRDWVDLDSYEVADQLELRIAELRAGARRESGG